MQNNGAALPKQAIDAALRGNWDLAIKLNEQILEVIPKDVEAKARLGRAYLQVGEFGKAKKLFKEVLEKDPINSIALKNYKLAKEKVGLKQAQNINPKTLIKIPGTSMELDIAITAKKLAIEDLLPGEPLKIRATKKLVKIYKDTKQLGESDNTKVLLGLKRAKSQSAKVTATFVSGNEKKLKIMLSTTIPAFKGEKQTVKPYLKKGTLDEPELELEEEID